MTNFKSGYNKGFYESLCSCGANKLYLRSNIAFFQNFELIMDYIQLVGSKADTIQLYVEEEIKDSNY